MKAYQNLTTQQNTGTGIAEYVLIASVEDFVTGGIKCPAAPQDADPLGLGIKITVDHEFKVGRGFAKIKFVAEKNSLIGKTIGDLGFQKLDFELKGFIPGSYAELHEQVSNMINNSLIVLVKDANCTANMWYQLGCDCTGSYMKADFQTSTTKDGAKGYDVTFTWQNAYVQLYDTVNGPEILV